jgi:hypothetical protein
MLKILRDQLASKISADGKWARLRVFKWTKEGYALSQKRETDFMYATSAEVLFYNHKIIRSIANSMEGGSSDIDYIGRFAMGGAEFVIIAEFDIGKSLDIFMYVYRYNKESIQEMIKPELPVGIYIGH